MASRRLNNPRAPGKNMPVNRLGGGGYDRQVNPWLSGAGGSDTGRSPLSSALGAGIDAQAQAQLALASNLLSNLLSPRQLPPSLLNLGLSPRPPGFVGAGMGQNYGGRDRFGAGPRNAGRDFGRRGNFNKGPNANVAANKRFGGDQNRSKNNQTTRNKPPESKKQPQQKEKKQESLGKTNQQEKKLEVVKQEQQQCETEKEIKEDPEGVQQAEEQEDKKMEQDEEIKEEQKDESMEVEGKTGKQEPSYSDLTPCILFCHVCRKLMWDALSFEKHLDGRPHKMMINELDQSYKMQVELLRHETRVMEQQRESDIQRAYRKGKASAKLQQQRGFCPMCDLNFVGTLPAHRRNDRHQRLKKFLHPKCDMCSKEFYTRLEWDDHKLTAGHLKKIDEVRKKKRPYLGVCEFDIVDFIEDVNDAVITYDPDIKVDGERTVFTEDEKKVIDDLKAEIEVLTKGKTDDDDSKSAKYAGKMTGEEFVENVSGYLCRACYRFMPTEDDYKVHCQTTHHLSNVLNILKIKDKICPIVAPEDVKKDAVTESRGESMEQGGDGEGEDEAEPPAKRLKTEEDTEEIQNDESAKAVTEQKASPKTVTGATEQKTLAKAVTGTTEKKASAKAAAGAAELKEISLSVPQLSLAKAATGTTTEPKSKAAKEEKKEEEEKKNEKIEENKEEMAEAEKEEETVETKKKEEPKPVPPPTPSKAKAGRGGYNRGGGASGRGRGGVTARRSRGRY